MKTILQKAAETIDRLGRDAQDCKSGARLPLCNAYRNEEVKPNFYCGKGSLSEEEREND